MEPIKIQKRTVSTPEGEITYELTRKAVKRLNLRLNAAGEVVMSVPLRCPAEQADDFVRRQSGWIMGHLRRREQARGLPLLPELGRRESADLLRRAVVRMLPRVAPLGVTMPEVKVRKMRAWGNCHWSQGYITLNIRLHRCPESLQDYVALHELVHFLHHDHGREFYAVMDALMPDWRALRRELQSYAAALEQ